ncbi:MAG: PKD domain-containing protein [Chitinophagales bacterium]
MQAQPGFEKVYGGSANDMLRAVYQMDDTSLIAVGFTESFGYGTVNNPDFYAVKMNFNGDTIWTQSFGSTSPDYAYAATALNDGYAFAGESVNPGNNTYDFFSVKTDFSGNLLWENYYGANGGDYCVSALTMPGNRLLLAGSTNSTTFGSYDFYLVETDAEGNQLADGHYGGSLTDILKKVIPTNDNGYLLIGNSNSFTPTFDVNVVKVDSNLIQQWSQTFESPGIDYGYDAIQDASGNFYILANQPTSTDSGFIKLIKTDAYGLNAVTFSVTTHVGDYGYGLLATNDGILITGNTFTLTKGSEYLLVKTDLNGDTLWTHHYGGLKNEVAFSLTTTNNGDIFLVGETEGFGKDNFDAYVVKVDSTGKIPCPSTVSFIASDSGLCEDQSVFFTNTSVSSAPFSWMLDGNVFSQEINAGIYFSDAGNYTVSLSSCAIENAIPVEVFSKPPSHFTYSLSGNTTSFLLTTPFTAASFSWDFGDGSALNTTDLNASHIYSNPGSYWVNFSATDLNGCDSAYTLQIEVLTATAEPESQSQSVSIYPNPVHQQGWLLLQHFNQFPMQAIIYDLAGRKLIQFGVTGSKQEFSVQSLKPGSYFLMLTGGDRKLSVTKLIIE